MKFTEIKEHTTFTNGQRISCISNDRSGTRPPVHLTLDKLYTVIDSEYNEGTYGMRNYFFVWVKNDDGIIEKYSSKRFEANRESILSELLD